MPIAKRDIQRITDAIRSLRNYTTKPVKAVVSLDIETYEAITFEFDREMANWLVGPRHSEGDGFEFAGVKFRIIPTDTRDKP